MKERRKFFRFKVPLRVEFLANVEMKLSSRGESLDFSREGLRITVPCKEGNTLHGDLIQLRIYLPQRTLPISFWGRVVWRKMREDSWEMGIKIEEMSLKEKSEILDYVYKIWKEKK